MRKLIALVAIAFALATGTSILAVTVRGDRVHVDQDSPYRGIHQKMVLQ